MPSLIFFRAVCACCYIFKAIWQCFPNWGPWTPWGSIYSFLGVREGCFQKSKKFYKITKKSKIKKFWICFLKVDVGRAIICSYSRFRSVIFFVNKFILWISQKKNFSKIRKNNKLGPVLLEAHKNFWKKVEKSWNMIKFLLPNLKPHKNILFATVIASRITNFVSNLFF